MVAFHLSKRLSVMVAVRLFVLAFSKDLRSAWLKQEDAIARTSVKILYLIGLTGHISLIHEISNRVIEENIRGYERAKFCGWELSLGAKERCVRKEEDYCDGKYRGKMVSVGQVAAGPQNRLPLKLGRRKELPGCIALWTKDKDVGAYRCVKMIPLISHILVRGKKHRWLAGFCTG